MEGNNQFNQYNEPSNSQQNNQSSVYAQVPVKTGFWNSFKNFWLQPIVLELTPYQKRVFKEVHDFWNQEIVVEHGEVHLRKAQSYDDDDEPDITVSL